jgi:hypothetical protein
MSDIAESWELFKTSVGGGLQTGTPINGIHFTLFYDYDELREGKLWAPTTSDDVRIEWFRRRMTGVLIEPLARLLERNSPAFLEVNSEFKRSSAQGPHMRGPWRTFTGSAFMVALTAVDALGLFVPPAGGNNSPPWQHSGPRFRNFIAVLLPQWNVSIPYQGLQLQADCSRVVAMNQGKLANILWKEFRCGFAHVFRSHGVGYDIYLNGRWDIVHGILEVNPIVFFQDFRAAFNQLCQSAQSDPSFRRFFLQAFATVYPPRA